MSSIWEEEFVLVYHMGKLSLEDVDKMVVPKRKWFIERLIKQKKKEDEARKQEQSKAKRSSATRPHRR